MNISITKCLTRIKYQKFDRISYLPVIENAPNLINMAIILHPIAQLTAAVLASSASLALVGSTGAGKVRLTLPFFFCFASVYDN